jgi:hypothetical protein
MMSEGIDNPLKGSSNSIVNFDQLQIFLRRSPIPSGHLQKGVERPLEQLLEGIG